MTKHDIAMLAAMLAKRAPNTGAKAKLFTPYHIALDATALARCGSAQLTNAINLCNVTDYRDTYNRKKERLLKKAQEIGDKYRLKVETEGDPRGGVGIRIFPSDGVEIQGNAWGEGYAL